MFLINSTQFHSCESSFKIGMLPSTFLPVGNKRLYELQIEEIKKLGDHKIYLSLPANFNLPNWDEIKLSKYNVDIIKVPQNLSLGESIAYSLNSIKSRGFINIICGGTLVPNLKANENNTSSTSFLAAVNPKEKNIKGIFSISNPSKLVKYLEDSNGDLTKALKLYDSKHTLNQHSYEKMYNFDNINSYFTSKVIAKTQRVFNDIEINDNTVNKRSDNFNKISAEANWYNNIPKNIKRYTPNFINHVKNKDSVVIGYNIEYLSLLSLNEVYVFGKAKKGIWENILTNCFDFVKECSQHYSNDITVDYEGLYLKKIIDRLEVFSQAEEISLDAPMSYNRRKLSPLRKIAQEVYEAISSKNAKTSLVHGDLCFSNMFYDFNDKAIKVIDPRGIDCDNKQTIFGDIRYDLAKMYHSIIGLYDHIIAGRYQLITNGKNDYQIKFNKTNTLMVKKMFLKLLGQYFNQYENDILPITIGLFLSMLPLHSDRKDRQYAFLANALKLYCKFKDQNK